MGEVIRKGAAADEIIGDVETTHTRALTREGLAKEEAEKRFPPVLSLINDITARIVAAKKTVDPLKANVEAVNRSVDDEVRRIYDDTWNLTGRSTLDPILYVLYPEGAGGYVEDDVDGQPLRMELLAALYESSRHPRIPTETAQRYAVDLRSGAGRLRTAVDALRGPAAELKLLESIRVRLAKLAQVELSRFKGALRTAGMSEAEVHEIIPDRGGPAPKKDEKKDPVAA